MSGEPVRITYEFAFEDKEVVRVEVRLDGDTLALIHDRSAAPPSWTHLSAIACQACPLDRAKHTHCPVAVSLSELVDRFSQRFSYENVRVSVTTEQRVISCDTSLQQGLSSLTGIYMVTSGCPVMDKLRPMVRFHLPFADLTETTYRATSMYMLAQFLRKERGLAPDWSLKGLEEIYRSVHLVNVGIARGIRNAAKLDANANALVRLDLFTGGVAFSIQAALKDLEHLFEAAYLRS